MDRKIIMDALVQTKRMGGLLNEVLDTSRQLAEALDRNDQVTIRMLLSMREEPVRKLKLADKALREQRDAIPDPEDARRLAGLLNGAEAQEKEERLLAEQVASNGRLLKQVLDLDRVLNRKLTRERSVYQ